MSYCSKHILICIAICLSFSGYSHGDLDVRIQEVSTQIEQSPNESDLYLKRGTLYYQHEEYLKSIRDFERVEQLSGISKTLNIGYAKSWYAMAEYQFSLENVLAALKIDPTMEVGHQLAGDIYFNTNQPSKAIKSYTSCLENSKKKRPELYFQLANAYIAESSGSSKQQAVSVYQQGLNDIGLLPVMLIEIVDKCQSLEDYDNAIKYQNKLIDISNRKEWHYYTRAEINIKAKKFDQATNDLELTAIEINELPMRLQKSKPIVELKSKLEKLQTAVIAKK